MATGLATSPVWLSTAIVVGTTVFIAWKIGSWLDQMDEGLGITDRVAQYMRTAGEYILPDNTTDLKTLMNSYCQ
jgi:hypothetical protein